MSSETDFVNIQKSISDYLTTKNTYFSEQNTQVENIFDKLSVKTSANINDLKKQVDAQNQQIEKQIFKNKSDSNETTYIKSEYQNIEINKLKSQNKILLAIYYVFVVILGVIMAVYSSLPIPAKFGIFVVLLVYPFVIYYIEIGIYIFFKYLYSLVSTSKFNNVYIHNY
jgi:cation transport ATPase